MVMVEYECDKCGRTFSDREGEDLAECIYQHQRFHAIVNQAWEKVDTLESLLIYFSELCNSSMLYWTDVINIKIAYMSEWEIKKLCKQVSQTLQRYSRWITT